MRFSPRETLKCRKHTREPNGAPSESQSHFTFENNWPHFYCIFSENKLRYASRFQFNRARCAIHFGHRKGGCVMFDFNSAFKDSLQIAVERFKRADADLREMAQAVGTSLSAASGEALTLDVVT